MYINFGNAKKLTLVVLFLTIQQIIQIFCLEWQQDFSMILKLRDIKEISC